MKAGTTSLYFYLREHPDVYMSPLKEPKFFAYDPGNPEHREKVGKNFPVTSMDAYINLFSGVSTEKAIGEASVDYLRSRVAAAAIRAHIPRARIIISLRNPVDRAVSLYTMNVRSGRETRQLREAFQTDELWVRSGLYHEDVKHYLEKFGRNKVKIVLFDELNTDSLHVMQGVFNFLGVDDSFAPNVAVRHNPGSVPKSKTVHAIDILYKRSRRLRNIVRSVIPYGLRRHIVRLGHKGLDMDTVLSEDTRRRMASFYHDDLLKLQDLIGIDLRDWLEGSSRRPSTDELRRSSSTG
jgi:hypothetical protein